MFNKKIKNKSFKEKVFGVVRKIKKGKVMTYAEVAAKVGSPQAARAVGSLLKTNFDPAIPCHRVIHSDGKIGGYNRGGNATKLAILKKEGAV